MTNISIKKINAFFIFLMTILALVLTISPTVQADSPTEVYKIDDLWNIRNDLSGYYILMNDLDFENNDDYVDWAVSKNENTTGYGWLPIGSYDDEFTGTFDGQNYTISNLFINRDSYDDYGIGLFGFTLNSAIININLIDVDLTGYDSVGGLIGFNKGYISKCSATGSVTGFYYVGGLIGDNWESSILKSHAAAQVKGETCVGGLIGSNAESLVEQSYVTENVGGLTNYDNTMGGLIGYNDGTITNCYATGDVVSDGEFSWYIGGLVGENDGGSIADCYSTGFVDGNSVVGGLLGSNTGTVENCFWDMQTSGQSSSDGGTGKTSSEMKNFNTFNDAGWDIAKIENYVDETWFINHTFDYPHLGWEPTYIPNHSPNTPSDPNPANHSTGIDTNANLTWTGGDPDPGDTVTYDIYFGTSISPPKKTSNQSSTNYDPGTMDYSTVYYWKIVAWDNNGAKTVGPLWDFTTESNNPPNIPSDPNPANLATDIDLNANLSWNGGDPDPDDTVTYDIYFGTSSNPPLNKSGHTSTIYDPGAMNSYTKYYWKIVAKDNHGASATGPIWDFTTIYVNLPPNTPNTPKPSDQSTRIGINADLSWTGGDPNSNDTVTYDIYFGTNSTPPLKKSNDTNTSYEPGILDYTTTYYWRIVAKDNHGLTSTGPIWSFTTGAQSSGGGGGGGGGSQTPMPIANASASDNSGLVNTAVRFDASYSYHEDGEITNYTWDFGDSNFGYGKIINHIYIKAGTYTVKLTVTDDYDVSDTDTFKVIISQPNNPPAAPQIEGPKTGKQNIEYNFTVFSTDPDNDNIQYVFNWGDDQTNETDFVANGTIYTEKHKWTSPGIYKISIYAVDINSAKSALAETNILIDVIYCKTIGYFIDEDSNGIYDLFYSNQTGVKTDTERQENGTYLINNDMDSDWDYIYNTQTGTLSSFSPETKPGETKADNTIFYAIAIVVIIVLLLLVAILGKKDKEEKKIEKEQQEEQDETKEKPKKQTTKKKQTKKQKKKSTAKIKAKKRKK